MLVSQGDITYLQIVDSMMIIWLFLMEWGRVRNLRFLTTLVPRRHMTTTCLIPDTGNFSFMVAIYIQITQSSCDGASTRYIAIFCHILPYSACHNILPNSASHISALAAFAISPTPSWPNLQLTHTEYLCQQMSLVPCLGLPSSLYLLGYLSH